jgi:hypothetical protein
MSTSSWLYTLLTLSAAFGISYFLGFMPVSLNSKVAASFSDTANGEPNSQNAQPTQDSEEVEVEVDRRLPPLQNQCLSCFKKSEENGKPMLRCSQCKNAFYCVSYVFFFHS